MIYCAYSGCGKTTYCKTHSTAIDLDSSLLDKRDGWEEEYTRIAETLSKHNFDVFISAHPTVIKTLYARRASFLVIIPAENKDTWRARLLFRALQNPTSGNVNALNDFDCNYDKDMKYYTEEMPKSIKLLRIHAKVNTDLEATLSAIG